MPGIFEKSVILIAKHDIDGAFGLIINKPSNTVKIDDILNFYNNYNNKNVEFKMHTKGGKYAWFGGPNHGAFHAIMR